MNKSYSYSITKNIIPDILALLPGEPRSENANDDPGFWAKGERIICSSEHEAKVLGSFFEDMFKDYSAFSTISVETGACSEEGSTKGFFYVGFNDSAKKNTVIEYMYRDSANWKVHSRVVINGLLTEEQIERIWDLTDEGYFLPSYVGLPENRFEKLSKNDGPYFELMDFSEAEECYTEPLTPEEVIAGFEKGHKNKWKVPRRSRKKPD